MIKNQVVLRQLQDEKQIDLLNAVFETQETERKRLAEDLHDSVGQVLSAIKLNLHRLDKIIVNDDPKNLLLIRVSLRKNASWRSAISFIMSYPRF